MSSRSWACPVMSSRRFSTSDSSCFIKSSVTYKKLPVPQAGSRMRVCRSSVRKASRVAIAFFFFAGVGSSPNCCFASPCTTTHWACNGSITTGFTNRSTYDRGV
jgi:hypothetical protein